MVALSTATSQMNILRKKMNKIKQQTSLNVTQQNKVKDTRKLPIKQPSYNRNSFFVVHHFDGQHGANINALFSLKCWLGSFNLSSKVLIVEPVITDTVFHMPYSLSNVSSTLRFSDFFDLEHYNNVSEAIGYPRMATLDKFYRFASKSVTFVQTYNPIGSNTHIQDLTARMEWSTKGSDCRAWNQVTWHLQVLESKGFCIKHVMKAPLGFWGQTFSPLDIFSREDLSEGESVLIEKWGVPFYTEDSQCKRLTYSSDKKQLRPSARMMRDVAFYEKNFLRSPSNVTVMLRIEHILMPENDVVFRGQEGLSRIKWCLDAAIKVSKEVGEVGLIPLITLDMGNSGSTELKHALDSANVSVHSALRLAKDAFKTLVQDKLTFEDWSSSFMKATQGTHNKAYIATLQRVLAARSRCLVLVGGGNFQELALRDYIQNHPDRKIWCIHPVCIYDYTTLGLVLKNLKISNAIL